MDFLEEIEINFPNTDPSFFEDFFGFLKIVKYIPQTNETMIPKISVKQLEKKNLTINFSTTNECLNIEVKNFTDKEWESSYKYSHITLDDLMRRISSDNILSIDHAGINLPWPGSDVHPLILQLREKLKGKCLYHLFPTGEHWDFIIPGGKEEIDETEPINYGLDRKPKFEIVSFETASTPIFQIDVALDLKYEKIKELFHEGIALDKEKCVWVYLKTSYDFDFCIVLSERGEGWTSYFSKTRLKTS